MRSLTCPPLLTTVALLILTGCGSGPGDSAATDQDTQAAVAQSPDGEDASGAVALKISARNYTSGSTQVKVSGFFAADGSQSLNPPASLTDDDQTWIQYGASGAPELNVLFTNSQSMAENALNIGLGPYSVTAPTTRGECRTHFDVTPAKVSGHYSCAGSTGYNKDTGQMGKVDIEVDFNASS